jgi:hypothetical protein
MRFALLFPGARHTTLDEYRQEIEVKRLARRRQLAETTDASRKNLCFNAQVACQEGGLAGVQEISQPVM